MAVAQLNQLQEYCLDVAKRAHRAASELSSASGAAKQQWLRNSARLLRERTAVLEEANARDLEAAPGYGLTAAQTDRLRLTPERVEGIAVALEEIAGMRDPVGEIIESAVRPNGLEVHKVRVPLGAIFFVYESRPNVTADAAALCVKSGNAVILRGGKEAAHSSREIVDMLTEALADAGLPSDAVQLVNTPDREAVGHFLALDQYITLAIPRGGEGLIRRVTAEAKMPVMKHFEGNCHVYIDASADGAMAIELTVNSKCQRLGVCNAAESLLVHADVAAEFLPKVGAELQARGVEIRGDQRVRELISEAAEATEDDYAAEYLDAVISAKVVGSLDEAIEHINRYSSHHTEAIVTKDLDAARRFAQAVDSSAVMINTSTRFNDGGELGLGAEIGISTDKLHARGPCGLKELTSYKYVVYGSGQMK